MEKINGNDLSAEWSVNPTNSYSHAGLPALDSKFLYYNSTSLEYKSNLTIIDKFSGELKSSIDIGDGVSPGTVMACDAINIVVPTSPSAEVINPIDNKIKYEFLLSKNEATRALACNSEMLYSIGELGIEARNLSNGSLAWTWNFPSDDAAFSSIYPEYIGSNFALFENIIFIRLANYLYAIDLKTHKTVWRHRMGQSASKANIAVSKNGILYTFGRMDDNNFTDQTAGIMAFNLQ